MKTVKKTYPKLILPKKLSGIRKRKERGTSCAIVTCAVLTMDKNCNFKLNNNILQNLQNIPNMSKFGLKTMNIKQTTFKVGDKRKTFKFPGTSRSKVEGKRTNVKFEMLNSSNDGSPIVTEHLTDDSIEKDAERISSFVQITELPKTETVTERTSSFVQKTELPTDAKETKYLPAIPESPETSPTQEPSLQTFPVPSKLPCKIPTLVHLRLWRKYRTVKTVDQLQVRLNENTKTRAFHSKIPKLVQNNC